MPMDEQQIVRLIKAAFPDATVEMTDLAGDGDHWRAQVMSSAFAGKTRIQQHKMVYAAIGPQMGGDLHALALQTFIPEREN